MVDNYSESIQLMAKFTVESLQMWQFAPNSIHYLLSLWQRMVASVPYVKATEPHLLETYTPEVTKGKKGGGGEGGVNTWFGWFLDPGEECHMTDVCFGLF